MNPPLMFYAVATFRPWSNLVPAPGAMLAFPIAVKGCGDGFFSVFFDRAEAVRAAEGDESLVVAFTGRAIP